MKLEKTERYAFLYLCGKRDRRLLTGKEEMTFNDFRRLLYLTECLGLDRLHIGLWEQYVDLFSTQLNALVKTWEDDDLGPELTDRWESGLEPDGTEDPLVVVRIEQAAIEDVLCQQEQWVLDFIRTVPDKQVRQSLLRLTRKV